MLLNFKFSAKWVNCKTYKNITGLAFADSVGKN
uniref:Uncharacterized protein n=1 Tax=Rhizophora mucronata TaxID=61149 RepID=A0A2P2P915_RHIMU